MDQQAGSTELPRDRQRPTQVSRPRQLSDWDPPKFGALIDHSRRLLPVNRIGLLFDRLEMLDRFDRRRSDLIPILLTRRQTEYVIRVRLLRFR